MATEADLISAAQQMHDQGAATAIVTAGKRGAIAVGANGAWRALSPSIEVVSSVGAGDALLAGMLFRLEAGASMEESLRWGAAAGAAACLTQGTQLCRSDEISRILPSVRVEQIELSPAGAYRP
jgi:6-phosphofructokinase 2